MFDSDLHEMTLSDDGSYTAYSKEYDEHYHSTRDGALKESLVKHVIPAFLSSQTQQEVHILDICYGLGFNTLATLMHYQQNNPTIKLNIYSPELDEQLVKSLVTFQYPSEFSEYEHIIEAISTNGFYEDEKIYIEVFLGDAREYVRQFKDKFDIVYQDAFSPSANPSLWTREYFKDIKNAIKKEGILTTYSISLATRLALYENDFNIYLNIGKEYRDATVASLCELQEYKKVDMKHKIFCNPKAQSLRD